MGATPGPNGRCSDNPPPRRRLSAAELALAAVGIAAGALILGFVVVIVARVHKCADQLTCYGNLGQIGLSTLVYAADYDGHLPLAGNWCDAVGPQYVKNLDCFRCPALPQARSGYAYNAALSGLDVKRPGLPPDLVMVYDGLGGWNASGGPNLFDPRHGGRGLVEYVDGRREWKQRKDLVGVSWRP